MRTIATPLQGCLVIEPVIYRDSRGYFYESYQQEKFRLHGIEADFVQDNQAFSTKGTLRGLHYQTGSSAQAKLIRVLAGSIFDVAVDIRPESPTYGQHYGIELNDENHRQLFIPAGFAHGYLTLSDTALVFYKCDQYYDPAAEGGLRYNDEELNISWPETDPAALILSERDKLWPEFSKHRAI